MASGVDCALLEECVECAGLSLALDEQRGHVWFPRAIFLLLLLLFLLASFSFSFRTWGWCWCRRRVARRRRWRWRRRLQLRAGATGWLRRGSGRSSRRRGESCGSRCGEKRELRGRRGEQRGETLDHRAAEAVTHLRTENACSAYESDLETRVYVYTRGARRAESTEQRASELEALEAHEDTREHSGTLGAAGGALPNSASSFTPRHALVFVLVL